MAVAQSCHLGDLVPPTLEDRFGIREHPGGPWEQQDGHVGIRNHIFNDLVKPISVFLAPRVRICIYL